jgi:methyltransferase (TIGR00027 family)
MYIADGSLDRDRRVARRQSSTAEVNAAQRAAEALLPPAERLFDDQYARYFVGDRRFRALLSSPRVARGALRLLDRWAPGLHAHILLRARYAADAVVAAAEEGIEQVVLLGAGFDSTAFRHEEPPLSVYEVDSPPTQAAKLDRLERHELAPRQRVVYVPCDLERDSPYDRLTDSGFDPSRRCVLVWLGVSMYLTREAFDTALGTATDLCVSGSVLVLDYMDAAVIEGTTPYVGARRLARNVARRGEPYLLGFMPQEVDDAAEECGFHVRDHVRTRELAARYGGPQGVWCRTDDYMGVVKATRW